MRTVDRVHPAGVLAVVKLTKRCAIIGYSIHISTILAAALPGIRMSVSAWLSAFSPDHDSPSNDRFSPHAGIPRMENNTLEIQLLSEWAECRMMYQHDQASMCEDARKAGLAEGLAEGAAQKRHEIAFSYIVYRCNFNVWNLHFQF